ncbi:MAG: hypothetical protein LLF92_11585 [Planctomycetaceae bacterium]|nr:hypothetical protein [Planctomycetaceae bacterium]
MKQKLWLTIITCLAYCIDKELYKAIEYLKEQVRVLKELQEKDKRILLNDNQRMRLARKAKELTRKLLEETSLLFSPDTILGWYIKLIAKKYDGNTYTHKKVGRPNTYIQTVHWVLKLKSENNSWGSQKICDCLQNLGFDISRTTVRNILLANGYDPEPNKKRLFRQMSW